MENFAPGLKALAQRLRFAGRATALGPNTLAKEEL